MKRFRYALDPLCLLACAAYALNRWALKPHVPSAFLHSHFNDLWLIPAALPLILWLQRRTGLRLDDAAPRWSEIVFHLVIWSVIAEAIAPCFLKVTGDPLDVLAYTAGALAAGIWWNRKTKTNEQG
ncbi:MAG: hypothetical protein JSR82_02870 [Verrucomicrobia bacterium]|nr:hypothetical protein [Verrucomicrobiota bacterium]